MVGSFNESRRRTPRRPVWIKTDTKNGQNQKSAEATRRALEPSAIGPRFVAQLHQHLTQMADSIAAR
ncbi:hypothetical protein AJ88_46505 [Mesorhizobium amorphae CCBAU 01583]|nr:hypothetical protein AJ88_46505 [Mesorhizobium amorphae CCBAU 01583]